MIDKQHDGAGLPARDRADAFDRIAIGTIHVEDDEIRRMFLHGFGQSFRRLDADDLVRPGGKELTFERMGAGGIAVGEKNFHGQAWRRKGRFATTIIIRRVVKAMQSTMPPALRVTDHGPGRDTFDKTPVIRDLRSESLTAKCAGKGQNP